MRALTATFAAALAVLVVSALAPATASARDLDCSDFSSQAAAQEYFLAHGGSASNNVDGLDADHDGVACESNPCPCGAGGPAPAPPPVPSPAPAPAPIPEPTPIEPAPEPPREQTFWKPFRERLEVEPTEIAIGTGTLGGDFRIGSLLSWEGWGTGRAVAEGTILLRRCLPSCVRGDDIRRPATVILSKPSASCARRRYTHIEILVTRGPVPMIGPYGTKCNGALTRP